MTSPPSRSAVEGLIREIQRYLALVEALRKPAAGRDGNGARDK